MKHKHADLIHAWADGAEIEWKAADGAWIHWESSISPPWALSVEYRIKPEEKKPVVRWLWSDNEGFYGTRLSECAHGRYTIKLEWSRTEFPE